MSSEWRECIIGDLCDSISETYKRNDDEVILINTSDVLDGSILNHTLVPNNKLKGQFKKTFRKNDILYSEIRPANKRFAFIEFDNTDRYIASTKLMVLRPRTDIVLPEFLFAILKSKNIVDELQYLAETRSGTFPQITFSSELAPMKVLIPDIPTQRRIVSVLKAIEDKIKINTRINEYFEQQALALFVELFGEHIDCIDKSIKLGELVTTIDNRGKTPPLEPQQTRYPIIDVKALSGS
ncbi:MAG: restriction endonuclease subunit S, partial [Clostridia bacterium]|nr:restriction endonuclease subunit S [Clostridia bacterium]